MSDDEPTHRLSGDEIAMLKFAGRRQLTRWASRHQLQPDEQARRDTLIGAVRVLENPVYAAGCELRAIHDR
jgi:hypothetical protein